MQVCVDEVTHLDLLECRPSYHTHPYLTISTLINPYTPSYPPIHTNYPPIHTHLSPTRTSTFLNAGPDFSSVTSPQPMIPNFIISKALSSDMVVSNNNRDREAQKKSMCKNRA